MLLVCACLRVDLRTMIFIITNLLESGSRILLRPYSVGMSFITGGTWGSSSFKMEE